ncbi:MAG: hypothetical protein JWO60_2642, partial [Frankiales bacterium]|nr:hypothetical protein [Frankiales bacterium]
TLPGGDLAERARALVKASAGKRGLVPAASPKDDDLADPYHAPEVAFQACAALVQEALRAPLDLLVGPAGS